MNNEAVLIHAVLHLIILLVVHGLRAAGRNESHSDSDEPPTL
jgi:hypothetical protein